MPVTRSSRNLFRRALGVERVEAIGEELLGGMVESIRARGSTDMNDVGDDLNLIAQLACVFRTIVSGGSGRS